jgi:hypothetical protein
LYQKPADDADRHRLFQADRRLAQHLPAHAHLHDAQPVIGLGQFGDGLGAQFAVLRQSLVNQPGQQVAFLLQHLAALLEKLDLTPDLQQGALGGRYGEAFFHGHPVKARDKGKGQG